MRILMICTTGRPIWEPVSRICRLRHLPMITRGQAPLPKTNAKRMSAEAVR